MPAKDVYHEHVKQALIKDDWKITHDPFKIVRGVWGHILIIAFYLA